MRKLISVLLLVLLLSAPVCLAHGGRLDSNGGHWNYSTGEYHYHEGPHAEGYSSGSSTSHAAKPSTTVKPVKKSGSQLWKSVAVAPMLIINVVLAGAGAILCGLMCLHILRGFIGWFVGLFKKH